MPGNSTVGVDALSLLRRFEPIVRFTDGEFFFPASVDDYVRCWGIPPDGRRHES